MERLVYKQFGENTVDILAVNEVDWSDENGSNKQSAYTGKAIDKLAEYEKTGLTPEEIIELKNKVLILQEELDISRSEVQGLSDRLVSQQQSSKPPMEFPRVVWRFTYQTIPKYTRSIVDGYVIDSDGGYLMINNGLELPLSEIGKSIFFTREEVQQALKQISNE